MFFLLQLGVDSISLYEVTISKQKISRLVLTSWITIIVFILTNTTNPLKYAARNMSSSLSLRVPCIQLVQQKYAKGNIAHRIGLKV